jgi:maltooligosyltrehalose trehalohydrolase
MFNYYQALIHFRKSNPVLKHLDRKHLNVQASEERQTLLVRRWHEETHLLCLMNFSKQEQHMVVPANNKNWNKLFDSSGKKWGGSSVPDEPVKSGSTITIQPESILIYGNDI